MNKWDHRFLELAAFISSWSKDPSTKCGAVIVRPDKTVASIGYNGFPRGVPDLAGHLQNREEKYERIIHAELNAILSAKEPLLGYTMYIHPGPCCARCATCVIQVGIKRLVQYGDREFPIGKPLDGWRAGVQRGKEMMETAGVKVDNV